MAEHEHVRVAVIGSGFGGLGAAVRLRREGITDFVVLERAGGVGGTWRDNSYPGCACDVPSHLYSFSFAPNPDWPRSFSGQEHIRAYLEHVTDTFGLRPHLRFNAEVKRMTWDAERLRWDIETTGGNWSADVVVSATGPLSEPKLPDVPGLDAFPGKVFHSARWDHDYDLRGKRVAVIGTGASAIQIVPSIQPQVEKLTLFQRTPAWVLPRMDRPIGAAERAVHRALPFTTKLRRGVLWGIRELQVQAFTKHPGELGFVEQLARRNMARAIKDPALRAKLTPDYRIGCKRILLSSTYYPALAQPNVDVVASGLTEVRGSTLVAADGTEAEVDAIVFSTGFHVTDMPIAERVVGPEGTTLAETWSGGMQALRGRLRGRLPQLDDDHRPQHRSRELLDDPDDRVPAELHGRLPAPARRPRGPGRPRRPPQRGPRLEPPGAGADEAHGVEHRRLHQLVPRRQWPQHHHLARYDSRVPARHPPRRPRRVRRAARHRDAARGRRGERGGGRVSRPSPSPPGATPRPPRCAY